MPQRAARRVVRTVLTLVALVGLLAGCGDISWAPPATPVTGDGALMSEVRTDGAFDRISVSAPVRVTIGEATEAEVIVEAEANVLPLISTEVVEGQLVVSTVNPGFITSDESLPLITIKGPGITSLALGGGSVGMLESTAPELRLDVSGGSTLTGIGLVPALTVSMAQGSHADLTELPVQTATVKMTDGSAATMTISDSVTGAANGGSTLTLTQPPVTQTVEVSGGASVLVR